MVRRQGTRFGVTTNHSVRRSNVASSNHETNQFVVVKTMSGAPPRNGILTEFSQQMQDGNLAINSGDDHQNGSPILYSLNKHKRWELPEMLKENILDEENHTESNFQVTLSERHIGSKSKDISSRSGDCIGVHQSKSARTQSLPKNTYSFETDLTASSRKRRRKKQRKSKPRQVEAVSEEVVADEEELLPEIHYEVCYPRPRNKYHNYGKTNKSHDGTDTVTVKSGKTSNKKACLGWKDWHEADQGDFEEFEDEEEVSSPTCWYEKDFYHTSAKDNEIFVSESPRLDESEVKNDHSQVSLGDVLVTLLIDAVCAENKQDRPRPKRRHNSKSSISSVEDLDSDTKDHIVIIDKEDAERFQPKEDIIKISPKGRARRHQRVQRRGENQAEESPKPQIVDKTPVEISFVKKISMSSLKCSSLQSTFGKRYREGDCRPRRFVINMKPTVEESLKNNGHERTAKTLMESGHQMMLLFEPFGCVEGVIGSNKPAYRQVRLKVFGFSHDFNQKIKNLGKDICPCDYYAYPWRAIKMEGPTEDAPEHSQLCSSSAWTVTQIIEYLQRRINEVCQESFYRADGAIGWAARQPSVTLDTVKTVTRIEWHSTTPSAIVQTMEMDTTDQPTNSSSDAKPTNCAICYESLMKSAGVMDASALTTCGHWFCNECWTQHLRSRIKQGDTNITCPEFKCDTPVDTILLLTYLTPKEYRTQALHQRNTILNSQQDWKWCPNTACGRLVKTVSKAGQTLNGDTTIAINCECGLLWCSSCKGEGHWPATCEQAAAYWKLIKKNGSVRWKLFPAEGGIQCVFVKKCPFCSNLIEKRHGCSFMWCVCKHAFCWNCLQDYYNHNWEECRKKRLQKVTIKQAKPVVTSMPGVALQHRERRTRLAVIKRRKAAEILAKRAFLLCQGVKEQRPLPRLLNTDDTSSIASSSLSSMVSISSCKSLPLTWMQDDEASWQLLQELLETAANAAKFCSEAEFCLEHLEVLCNDPNTELKSPATLYQLKDRLIFIADQLHMILHGELEVNPDSAMGRVAILMNAGKRCLKWIVANVPLVLSQDEE